MEFYAYKNKIVARLDKGEEVVSSLLQIAKSAKVSFASVSGIGATDSFSAGVFDAACGQYAYNNFSGSFEILSLAGTIASMDGEPYAHLHIAVAGEGGKAFGGHLVRAVVSVTCEVVLDVFDCPAVRKRNGALGINELKFN